MDLWEPVSGYEGLYEVSNTGLVRSIERIDCRGQKTPCRVLKAGHKPSRHKDKTVMLLVTLCKNRDKKTKYIHHLVAQAFIGDRPDGYFVCHKDGDATNNTVGNLYYGTPTENMADAARHGTTMRGEKNNLVKLTEEQVKKVRATDLSERGSKAKLARELNVSPSTIASVIHSVNWRWLDA